MIQFIYGKESNKNMIPNNKIYKQIIEKLEDTSISGFHNSLDYMKRIGEFYDYVYSSCVCSNKYLKDFAEEITGNTYSENLTNKEYLHDIAESLGSQMEEDNENYYLLEILELIDSTPKTLTALSINVPLDLVYSDEFNITGTLLDANNNPIGSARVSLLVGNTIVDTKTTNNQGVVSFTQTPVHTGNHTFQLRYTGDTTYKASSSSIVSRVVGKETSVLTLNNPVDGASYEVDGTVTITGLLTDNDGTPLANKIITVSNGLSYTTSSNGSFTGSTSYSTSGEYTLTFTYVGDDNYTASTVTRNIIVNEQVVYDDIILTSDKSILSSYDSDTCTLTAQLMNGSDTASVQDEIVTFYQDGTLIDTSLTDATGKAQYVYSSQGIGDTVFEAKVGSLSSETYSIEDCIFYGINTSAFSIPSNTTFTSDGDKITATTSTTGEKIVYFNHTFSNSDNWVFETELAQLGTTQHMAIIWNDNTFYGGSVKDYNTAYYAMMDGDTTKQIPQVAGDVYRIVRENGVTTVSVNTELIVSKTISHKSTFKVGYFINKGRTQYYKNIKLKPL